MGYMGAIQMRMLTDEDTALRWHLNSNLYPPVPDAFDLCKQALDALEEGDQDRLLTDGDLEVRAYQLVSVLHLDAFVVARQVAADDDLDLEDDDDTEEE